MTYIIYERVVAIGDLNFLNEENLILQDQLDHMAKIDPNGLEALRNGIDEALTKNTYSRDTRLVKKYTIFVSPILDLTIKTSILPNDKISLTTN